MTDNSRATFQCVARRPGTLELEVLAAGALPDTRQFYELLAESEPETAALLARNDGAIIAKRGLWRGIAYKLLSGR